MQVIHPHMDTTIVPLPAFSDNYIWTLRDAKRAIVVDPGDAEPVLSYLAAEHLELVAILNTHHHADHVGGDSELLQHFRVPVFGPKDPRIPQVSDRLEDGDRMRLPHFGVEMEVMEIPGHTRTHIAFFGEDMLFCGDTLFAVGCGRLFEGTPEQMFESLGRLTELPDRTRVFCGHEYTLANIAFAKAAEPGNATLKEFEEHARTLRKAGHPTLPTDIGQEKKMNPFLRCNEPEIVATASRYAGQPLSDPVSVLGAIREWKNNFK